MTPVRESCLLALCALGLAVLSGCGEGPATEGAAAGDPPGADPTVAGDESAELAELRRLAEGFRDLPAAQAAGYTDQATSCWYHRDLGGQGYHYVRPELMDGTVSLLEPEMLMYEPHADGSLEFLAVEYVVPFEAWDRDEPPRLLGQEFTRNDVLDIYVLHVWVGKENPSGLYANWNPNVSCEHADESEDRA